ncbi:MAG: protease complex subunit PrcB family protein, partial [Candidatus Saliniplasma sp.]
MKDKTIYLGILIFNAAILVTAGAYLPVEGEGESVDFESIESGFSSNRRANETEVFIINNTEDYERIIGSLGNDTEINFEENSVIAVLLGQRGTGGYSIRINEIVEKDEKIVIHALETRPGKNCTVTMGFIYPYEAV